MAAILRWARPQCWLGVKRSTPEESRDGPINYSYLRVWAHHRCRGRQLYEALTRTAAMIAKLGLGQLSDLLPERVIETFNDRRAKDKDEVLAVMGKTPLHCEEAGD